MGLARKNRLSLLRSADEMERLALAGKNASVASIRSIADAGVDERDLTTLARALALVDDAVFADVAENFFHDVFLLESPSSVTDRIVVGFVCFCASLQDSQSKPTPLQHTLSMVET